MSAHLQYINRITADELLSNDRQGKQLRCHRSEKLKSYHSKNQQTSVKKSLEKQNQKKAPKKRSSKNFA